MLKRLWDYLFPKYTVHWRLQVGPNMYEDSSSNWDSKGAAKRFAEQECAIYGKDTYWVTDKDGKVV